MIDIVTGDTDGIKLSGGSILLGDELVDNLESNERPMLLSELIERLAARSYCIPPIRQVDSYGNLCIGDWQGDMVDYIPSAPTVGERVYPEIDQESIKYSIDDYYKAVLEMKDKDGETFYSSSKVTVDFLSSTVTFNLLEDDEYTNTVSLSNIAGKLSQPGISGKVDLTVKYNKSGLHCADLTFEAFKVGEDGDQLIDNFISSLGDVTVEYVGGVVRVIPDSLEVGECIISNCILTYGTV